MASMVVGDQEMGPVRQNGEKQAHGDTVGSERTGPLPGKRGVLRRERRTWPGPGGG